MRVELGPVVIGAGVALLVIALTAGVVLIGRPPSTPLASIPQALLDLTGGTTKIYLRGFEDTRYDRLSIRITELDVIGTANVTTNRTDSETYSLASGTESRHFVLNLTGVNGDDYYALEMNVTVNPFPGNAFALEIAALPDPPDPHTVPVKELPWKTVLNRIPDAG